MKEPTREVFNDDKEARTIWWILTKWNLNSMAYKSNRSGSIPKVFFKNIIINLYSHCWSLSSR